MLRSTVPSTGTYISSHDTMDCKRETRKILSRKTLFLPLSGECSRLPLNLFALEIDQQGYVRGWEILPFEGEGPFIEYFSDGMTLREIAEGCWELRAGLS